MSRRRRLADLGQDVGLRPHPLVPAGIGDDAKAAELVAALDNRDVRLDRIASPRHAKRPRHIVVGVQVQEKSRSFFPGRLLDEHRETADGLRADHNVSDAGRALENRLALLLGHATGDRDDGVVPLFRCQDTQLAKPGVQLFLGPLANAAGVDDDDVRVGGILGRLEAGLL
jgi:hypothetical protein